MRVGVPVQKKSYAVGCSLGVFLQLLQFLQVPVHLGSELVGVVLEASVLAPLYLLLFHPGILPLARLARIKSRPRRTKRRPGILGAAMPQRLRGAVAPLVRESVGSVAELLLGVEEGFHLGHEICQDLQVGLIDVDHDVQLLDDVLDLPLELPFGVDVEESDVEVGGVGFRLGSVDGLGHLGPKPEFLKRGRLSMSLPRTYLSQHIDSSHKKELSSMALLTMFPIASANVSKT